MNFNPSTIAIHGGFFRRLGLAATGSSLALLVSAVTIIGWKLMYPALLSPLPGLPQTSPINAFILVLLGLSLMLARQVALERLVVPSRVVAWAMVVMAFALAVHALVRYASGLALQFEDAAGPVEHMLDISLIVPGRPSPHTAATMVMLSCALVCAVAGGRRHLRIATGLASVSLCIPWIALFGYASGFDPFYSLPNQPQSGMGIYTAMALLALAFGIMGLAPDMGLLGLWRSSDIGGKVTRWILPVAAGGPLLFGRMAVTAQEAGFFNTVAGFALICVVNAIVLAALTVLTASVLDTQEKAKRLAQQEKERLLKELQASTEDLRELQRGFVTVCAWTRRVLDGGKWVEFEEFLQNHLRLRFSHGMSAEAAEVMRHEIDVMKATGSIPDLKCRQGVKVPSCAPHEVAQGVRA